MVEKWLLQVEIQNKNFINKNFQNKNFHNDKAQVEKQMVRSLRDTIEKAVTNTKIAIMIIDHIIIYCILLYLLYFQDEDPQNTMLLVLNFHAHWM